MLFTDIVDAGKEAITLNDEKVTTDDKEQSKTFLNFNAFKNFLDVCYVNIVGKSIMN